MSTHIYFRLWIVVCLIYCLIFPGCRAQRIVSSSNEQTALKKNSESIQQSLQDHVYSILENSELEFTEYEFFEPQLSSDSSQSNQISAEELPVSLNLKRVLVGRVSSSKQSAGNITDTLIHKTNFSEVSDKKVVTEVTSPATSSANKWKYIFYCLLIAGLAVAYFTIRRSRFL